MKPSDSKYDLDIKPTENEIWKGFNRYFPKDANQKSEGGQWGPIYKDSSSSDLKLKKVLEKLRKFISQERHILMFILSIILLFLQMQIR